MHYLRARIGDRRPLLFVTCWARRSAKTLSAIALIRITSAVAVSASCVIIRRVFRVRGVVRFVGALAENNPTQVVELAHELVLINEGDFILEILEILEIVCTTCAHASAIGDRCYL